MACRCYWQLLNLANYAPCTSDVTLPLPRGWDVVEFFDSPPLFNTPAPDLPFGVLLKVRAARLLVRRQLLFLSCIPSDRTTPVAPP